MSPSGTCRRPWVPLPREGKEDGARVTGEEVYLARAHSTGRMQMSHGRGFLWIK